MAAKPKTGFSAVDLSVDTRTLTVALEDFGLDNVAGVQIALSGPGGISIATDGTDHQIIWPATETRATDADGAVAFTLLPSIHYVTGWPRTYSLTLGTLAADTFLMGDADLTWKAFLLAGPSPPDIETPSGQQGWIYSPDEPAHLIGLGWANPTDRTIKISDGTDWHAYGGTSAGGAQTLFGAGDPDAALGDNDDTYIDTAAQAFWKKAADAWTVQLTITGGTLDIHDDIATQLNALAATDRSAWSDESAPGDPTKWASAETVRTYMRPPVATSAEARQGTSGNYRTWTPFRVREATAATPLNIHVTAATELTELADADRSAWSDEDASEDPTKWASAETVRNYMRPPEATDDEAREGTSADLRSWTPARVRTAAAAAGADVEFAHAISVLAQGIEIDGDARGIPNRITDLLDVPPITAADQIIVSDVTDVAHTSTEALPATAHNPRGVTVAADEGLIWVANHVSRICVALDVADLTADTAADVDFSTVIATTNMYDIHATASHMYAADDFASKIKAIDRATGNRDHSVEINLHADNLNPGGIVLVGDTWFVTDRTSRYIHRYLTDGTELARLTTLPAGFTPFGIEYHAGLLWVADGTAAAGTVRAMDPDDGTLYPDLDFDLHQSHDHIWGIARHADKWYAVDADADDLYLYTGSAVTLGWDDKSAADAITALERSFQAGFADVSGVTQSSFANLLTIPDARIHVNVGDFVVVPAADGTSTIRVPADGRYLVIANIVFQQQTSTIGNARITGRIRLASIRGGVTTGQAARGIPYVRGQYPGFDKDGGTVIEILDLAQDDEIAVQLFNNRQGGTLDIDGPDSSISIACLTPDITGTASSSQQTSAGEVILRRNIVTSRFALTESLLSVAWNLVNTFGFPFAGIAKDKILWIDIGYRLDSSTVETAILTRTKLDQMQATNDPIPSTVVNSSELRAAYWSGRSLATADAREPDQIRPTYGWIEARRQANRSGLLIALDDDSQDRWSNISVLASSNFEIDIEYITAYYTEVPA